MTAQSLAIAAAEPRPPGLTRLLTYEHERFDRRRTEIFAIAINRVADGMALAGEVTTNAHRINGTGPTLSDYIQRAMPGCGRRNDE